MTPISDIADRTAVRMDLASRAALATIITVISTPHRRPATVSEAIRAALAHTAATLPAASALALKP